MVNNFYEKPPRNLGALLVVALLVVAGLAGWAYQKPVVKEVVREVKEKSLGGLVNPLAEKFENGIQIGDTRESWISGKFAAATGTSAVRNRSGVTRFVDYVQMWNPTSASSSLLWTSGTSTASASADFTHLNGVFFDSVLVATSTQTVIASGGTQHNNIDTGAAWTGLVSTSTIAWKDGEWLFFRMETGDARGQCGGAAAYLAGNASGILGSTCASATSSMGYTPEWKVHYFER